ncbi:hypothetical protein Psed_0706 [Pseudonocardia dioxanivorans CB1190]|uniref:Uncharacterized protein n=1 Tax=Pseudonocardia dioxanivorans (strain ATCC 55486 / DSM 44775 / JCM 13855 / CB1190) TaxID=675635 RepID=F4CKJ9_PSEUX|nr:hypothetical protein [Pseudonocardia dioxanivorans]AEA22969.1 hypothetical protein Psed_0706 [Pseudonocardia dioxanivorans CB1190]
MTPSPDRRDPAVGSARSRRDRRAAARESTTHPSEVRAEDGVEVGAEDGAEDDDCVTAAVARLAGEFAGRVDRGTVRRTVVSCRADLDAAPPPALPELVERLARQRLLQLAGRASESG